MPQEFWRGIEEFNREEFYACHDTLEAIWMEAGEPQRSFYQGILQISVGLYHLSDRNWRGAVVLLGEGISKLAYYQPDYLEIDIENLLGQTSQLLKALQEAGPEKITDFSDGKIEKPKIVRIDD
ncbi:MAG: DUF309 domain-containing protein [Okeania sp. SIO2H7]|nr:DUF309 domain-containing protein [Okeania sp. SIO2H7]